MPDVATTGSLSCSGRPLSTVTQAPEGNPLPSPMGPWSWGDPETPLQTRAPPPPCLPPGVSQAMTQCPFLLPLPIITQDTQWPLAWSPTVPGQSVHTRFHSLATAAPCPSTLSLVHRESWNSTSFQLPPLQATMPTSCRQSSGREQQGQTEAEPRKGSMRRMRPLVSLAWDAY